jgi:polyhydroxybutyrate depolymerase
VKVRKAIIGAAALFIGLPLLLGLVIALAAMVAIRVLDRHDARISSSGEQREYLLHVPPGYDPAKPTPLVISLHGAALWPAVQQRLSGWNRLADEQGFIVVYPSAGGTPKIWHVDQGPGLDAGRNADVRFIADLIDDLEAKYHIDRTRIYANGLSNGGGMAFVLSCTLSDRIAAIGMVAAAQSLPWDWCSDRRPIAMIDFHGTDDPVIPYEGGASPVGPAAVFPSVRGWAANWARRNRCGPDPLESAVTGDVSRLQYGNCADDASVVLYTVQGGGHSWPGGPKLPRWMFGTTNRSIDATRIMWKFFLEHPLATPVR